MLTASEQLLRISQNDPRSKHYLFELFDKNINNFFTTFTVILDFSTFLFSER